MVLAKNPRFTTTVAAGVPYYRIAAQTFRTGNPALNKNVVNGVGARTSRHGARYNYPGTSAVYLAENVETALAERMFYFQREVVQSLDTLHLPAGSLAPFSRTFVLWEIELQKAVPDVLLLDPAAAVHTGCFRRLCTILRRTTGT